MRKRVRVCRICVSIIVLCFVASTTVSADGPRKTKVFLLGGQSNMAGLGKTTDMKDPYSKPFNIVKIWNAMTRKWEPLEGNFGASGKGSFGPELSFGHAIAEALPNDDVRLVKYAVIGTALYNGWAPTSGAQYVVFMNTAKAALSDLKASRVDYEIAGMLWLQGESDAAENQAATYEKNLAAFITHMRTEFKTPKMAFIIARVLGYYGGQTGQAKIVRDAQVKVAKSTENVTWFDTDDCERVNEGHYSSSGLIEIGKRFAAGYSELTGNRVPAGSRDSLKPGGN